MMILKKIILFSGLLAVSAACTKKATIKLPEPESKLVVTCFISPGDTIITATVRGSVPKYGSGSGSYDDDIINANVVISSSAGSISLPFNADLDCYVIKASQFPVHAGETYSLMVSTPDGKQANASTTVPSAALDIKTLDITIHNDATQPGNMFLSFDYDLRLVVNDLSNETEYVNFVFSEATGTYKASYEDTGPQTPVGPIDTLYNTNLTAFFDTDEYVKKPDYNFSYSSSFYGFDTLTLAQVNISVLHCNREFYLYNQSVQKAAGGEDNPFSEPVLIYSNITNGFGCFGAYVGTYVSRKLK